jgi:hypothetical protein
MRLPKQPEPTAWEKLNRHLAVVEEKARLRDAIHRGVERHMKAIAEQRQREFKQRAAETQLEQRRAEHNYYLAKLYGKKEDMEESKAAIDAAKTQQERICSEYDINQKPNSEEGVITNE